MTPEQWRTHMSCTMMLVGSGMALAATFMLAAMVLDAYVFGCLNWCEYRWNGRPMTAANALAEAWGFLTLLLVLGSLLAAVGWRLDPQRSEDR